MSKYSDYLRKRKESSNDFYFGEGNWKKISNQYIKYKSVLDENTIIIRTGNIKNIKGNFVLLVGNNKGVYLKEWQVRPFYNCPLDISGYLVKLSRDFFKIYTFKSDCEGYSFSKDEISEI